MDRSEAASITSRELGRFKVDLGDLKPAWIAWCRERGVSPGDGLRQVVAKLTGRSEGAVLVPLSVVPPGEPASVPMRIYLTPSECAAVKDAARRDGMPYTRWVAALVRGWLTKRPQLNQSELEALVASNAALLRIGRNLNQVARALNTSPHERLLYKVELIEELRTTIEAHTKTVAATLQASVDRWSIR